MMIPESGTLKTGQIKTGREALTIIMNKYDVSLDKTLTVQVADESSDEEIEMAFMAKLFRLMWERKLDHSYFSIEESE